MRCRQGRKTLTAHTPRCGYPRRSLGFILLQRFVGRPRRRACLTRTAGIAICNAAVERRSGRLLGASGLGCRRLGAGIAVFSIATGMWQAGGLGRSGRRCGGRVCRYGFVLGHFQLSPFQHADGRTTKSGHWGRTVSRAGASRLSAAMSRSSWIVGSATCSQRMSPLPCHVRACMCCSLRTSSMSRTWLDVKCSRFERASGLNPWRPSRVRPCRNAARPGCRPACHAPLQPAACFSNR